FKLFPLIHVAVGALITYATAAYFVNKTTIRASGMQLTVRHGPLPWSGNLDSATAEIEELFTKEKVNYSRNGSSTTYDVKVILRNGGRKDLGTGLNEAQQALFIEQRVEAFLGLKHAPVP